MWCYRRKLKVLITAHVANSAILKRVSLEHAIPVTTIRKRRMMYINTYCEDRQAANCEISKLNKSIRRMKAKDEASFCNSSEYSKHRSEENF